MYCFFFYLYKQKIPGEMGSKSWCSKYRLNFRKFFKIIFFRTSNWNAINYMEWIIIAICKLRLYQMKAQGDNNMGPNILRWLRCSTASYGNVATTTGLSFDSRLTLWEKYFRLILLWNYWTIWKQTKLESSLDGLYKM